jgi:small GTP-binding protein
MYQFAVLGAAGVGKSALVRRWISPDTFVQVHKETVEESFLHSFELSGIRVPVQIIDSSGSYCFPSMRRLLALGAHGFLLVYDVNNRDSLKKIVELKKEIERVRCERGTNPAAAVPVVIVANKTDGSVTSDTVPLRLEARKLAEQLGCEYVETSAKENYNVNEAFRRLVGWVSKSYSLSWVLTATKWVNNIKQKRKRKAVKIWKEIRRKFIK